MRVQREGALPALALAGGEVQRQVAHPQQATLALEAPPEQGAQAGQQLRQSEGLDQVVVGTRIESLDAVVDGVARREHEDRRVVAGAAHAAADGQAVDIGQPEVEDQRVRRGQRQRLERLAARGHGHHLVALEAQGAVDRSADGQVVVHHEDAHGARSYRRGAASHGRGAPGVAGRSA